MPPNSRPSATHSLAAQANPTKVPAIVAWHPAMNIPRENLKSPAIASAGPASSRESEPVETSGEPTMESSAPSDGVCSSGSSGKVPERRSSSEFKQKLHGSHLMSSVQTADSWGQHTPAALPSDDLRVEGSDSDLSSSDPDDEPASPSHSDSHGDQTAGIDTIEAHAASPAHRSQSWCPDTTAAAADTAAIGPSQPHQPPPQDDDHDHDNVANYINMSKLLRSSSSDYAYSRENAKSRKLLDKVAVRTAAADARRSRRKSDVDRLLDDSTRSRESVLTLRSSASAYRGPEPRLKNGRRVKGVMKKRGSLCSVGGGSSGRGSAQDEQDEEEKEEVVGQPSATVAKPARNISFSSVDIREHERIAGDNPCVSQGVPLSIGWGYYQHDSIDLDDYEHGKGPARDQVEMMVPSAVRRAMLRQEFGVSIKEMNEAMKRVNIAKRQRRHTVATEHLEGWAEVLQSAKRKFKRMVKRTTTEKEQQKLWEKAHKCAMGEYLKARGEGSWGNEPEEVGIGEKNVGPLIDGEGSTPLPFSEIEFDSAKGNE
ncbi:hypothetical protein ACHAXS_001751 [Conticribra weissflogii]